MTDALSKLRELVGKMDHYISALTGTHAKDICFRCQIEAILLELEQRERDLLEKEHVMACPWCRTKDERYLTACGRRAELRAALNPTEAALPEEGKP